MTTRLRNALIIVAVIVVGSVLALVAQPPPLAFAAGWSAPRRLTPIDLRDSRSIVLADDQSFHLAWANVENSVSQVFSARLSPMGEWLQPPTRLSSAGVRSVAPQLTLLPDGTDLVAYIEKSQNGGLMLTDGKQPPRRVVEAIGDMRQLTLALDRQGTFWLAWSENRESQPYIYLTYFYGWADKPAFIDFPQRLNPEAALAMQPLLQPNSYGLNTFYFTDDNKFVDLRLRTLDVLPGDVRVFLKLRGDPAILSHRGQNGSTGAYPVTVRADAQGMLYVFESVGPVRLTRFDQNGARLDAQPITLDRVRTSGAVDVKIDGTNLWLAWSGAARAGRPQQIFVRRFDLNGKPQADEARLTFTTAGAFQPHWFVDRASVQHLFWVENVSDREAALFYANSTQPADVALWQRLGFGGSNALATLLFTLASAFMFALLLLLVNVWRILIVALLLLLAFRLTRGRISVMLLVFVVAELLLSAPTSELIGQPPITLSGLAHWAFIIPSLALSLQLLREWRKELSESLRWPALAVVFSFIYYWMNAIVILREAYAV